MGTAFTLIATVFFSIFLEQQAAPGTGFWNFIYIALEDTSILAVIRDTAILCLGIQVFDRFFLPFVDSWQLIRHGTIGKGADQFMVPKERVGATLRLQGVVMAAYILSLAFIIYTS